MKKVPSTVVKRRSRDLTSVFEAFTPYVGMEGRVERIWITEVATDGIHLVSLSSSLSSMSGKCMEKLSEQSAVQMCSNNLLPEIATFVSIAD